MLVKSLEITEFASGFRSCLGLMLNSKMTSNPGPTETKKKPWVG